MTSRVQVTIPVEVRHHLGVGTPDRVAFVLEDDEVHLCPAATTLASLFGSVPALPHGSADLEREIDEAMQGGRTRSPARVVGDLPRRQRHPARPRRPLEIKAAIAGETGARESSKGRLLAVALGPVAQAKGCLLPV